MQAQVVQVPSGVLVQVLLVQLVQVRPWMWEARAQSQPGWPLQVRSGMLGARVQLQAGWPGQARWRWLSKAAAGVGLAWRRLAAASSQASQAQTCPCWRLAGC